MSKSLSPRTYAPAIWTVVVVVAAMAAFVAAGHTSHSASKSVSGPAFAAAPVAATAQQRNQIRATLSTQPLAFEANQGQTDPQVKYMARSTGYTVFLTANDAVFSLQSHTAPAATSDRFLRLRKQRASESAEKGVTASIRMRLVRVNPQTQIAAGGELPGVTNYYMGNDPSKWTAGVKQYAAVTYRNAYPGVNLVFHGRQRQMEFDFVVAAGANPEPLSLGFSGAGRVAADAAGNLVLSSAAGNVVLHKPVAYQEKDGVRQEIAAGFVQQSRDTVGFSLGAYDRSRELVIDPALSYSTYLGGSGEDEAFGIAIDASGNAYVAGQTASPNFPAHSGTKSTTGGFDAFVTKLDASGSSVVFTTLIGGASDDSALAVAVNSTGTYIVGNTLSSSFPSTTNLGPRGGQDTFVAKLDSTAGTAQYITRIGGSGVDTGQGIAVDASGNAYIGGETTSTDFPLASAIQSTNSDGDDAFVAKLNAAGTTLAYSTYLGGSNSDLVTGIALDSSNNAYVTGITVSTDFPVTTGAFQTSAKGADEGFVAQIRADGSAGLYSTYLGGSGTDDALGIAVDSAGEAYVTGNTNSSNFPTLNAAQASNAGGDDVFVTKLNATGTAVLFSTYLGGTLDEVGTGIALDSFGDAYVTGRTTSSNYPVSGSPFQSSMSGTSDAFVTELSNTGFAVYSSYLGGTANENSISGNTTLGALGAVAVDSSSNAYLAGDTNSNAWIPGMTGFQTAYGGGLADGFVAKVGPAPADFSVAVSPISVSTTSGQTTSAVTVTVSSVNASYGQAVTLTCGSVPAKAACSFTSSSVTPGATAQTSSLTITTNGASSSSMLAPTLRMFYAMLLPIGGIALLAGNNPRRKRLFGFLLLGTILTGLLMLPACGGGGGGGGGNGSHGTTPGTYNITVSGQAGGVTHSAPLKLVVN